VKILDERRNANGGTVDWYRIAPPTGELRWIAGRDVSSEGEPKQSPGPASVPEADPQAQPDVPEPFDRGAVEAQRATASSTQPDREPGPTRPENAESGPSTRYTAKPYAPISESEDSTFRRDPSRGQSGRARRAPATGPAEPVVQFDPSPMLIAEANRDLVVMIRQDISLWDFTAIRRRFEEARDRATTPSGRAQALDRLDHLARYERIKANHDGFQSAMARSRYRDRAVESARQRQVEQQGPPRPRHDGSGVLRRAPFQGAGAPRYVLTDAQGNVRYYVVPGAGVDLHSYLGETVAVYGTQSYHADLLAHQITVRQVLPIAPTERAELVPPTRFE
jgi:hypothetical protein